MNCTNCTNGVCVTRQAEDDVEVTETCQWCDGVNQESQPHSFGNGIDCVGSCTHCFNGNCIDWGPDECTVPTCEDTPCDSPCYDCLDGDSILPPLDSTPDATCQAVTEDEDGTCLDPNSCVGGSCCPDWNNNLFCDECNPGTDIICHSLYPSGAYDPCSDLYWSHDLDAYQLMPITEEELGLDGLDAGFCDYGRKPNWQLGSMFFKKEAEDIFRENAKRHRPGLDHNRRLIYDENIMIDMTNENFNKINSRIKRMNITYDFGMRKIGLCYKKAIKPLRILHFDPESKKLDTLKIAMYGENDLKRPLMTNELIKIFRKHGIK